nr:MAG TPA: hypothetical protein [Caudoviricetes sp.]
MDIKNMSRLIAKIVEHPMSFYRQFSQITK